MKLLSPAKLNLFLHIVGQRSDGYHLLQSVIQLLDFGDELIFETRKDSEVLLTSNVPALNTPDNLIFKAAKLLSSSLGCTITLNKRIPMGAGLGGGSSNAATALLALNKLWELNLTIEQLAEMGLKLGADVPFFVRGHSAWIEGIGEKNYPLQLPEAWFVVVTPPISVSTHEIYSHSQLTRHTEIIKIREFRPGMGHNDCESLVCKKHPQIHRALQSLAMYAPARMSGTGSSLFATFNDQKSALLAAKQLQEQFPTVVAKGLNISPAYWAVAKW